MLYPFLGDFWFFAALLPVSVLAVVPLLAARTLVVAAQPATTLGVQFAALCAVAKGVFGGLLLVYAVRVLSELVGMPLDSPAPVLFWLSAAGYLVVGLISLLFVVELLLHLLDRERTCATRWQWPLGLLGLAIAFVVLVMQSFALVV